MMKPLNRKPLAILVVMTMLLSMLPMATFAEKDLQKVHSHSDSCYAPPANHVCSLDTGCTPVYPMTTAEIPDTTAPPNHWNCGALVLCCKEVDTTLPIVNSSQEQSQPQSSPEPLNNNFQVGENFYEKLEQAAAEVPDGGTILMLKDVSIDYDVELGYEKKYTINLNG
ncbi:MAG: hypothetical protein RR472_02245, partial [Anaerovoracaceae bacterium]